MDFSALHDLSTKTGQRILIATVSLASLVGALDMSIVNITMPTIDNTWKIPIGLGSLAILSYMLTVTSLILVMGKLGDRYGFRRLFMLGLVLFGSGSLLCGMAPDIYFLIVSRILQGAGAAMFSAIGPAIIATYLPPTLRGRSLGYLISLSAVGFALGPGLGGFITQYINWRWVFFLNLPIVLAAIILAWHSIPRTMPKQECKSLDLAGVVMFILAILLILSAFSLYQVAGTPDSVLLSLFVSGIVVAGIFLVWEHRSPNPLINRTLVNRRDFWLGIVTCLIITTLFSGVTYLMPIYLINSRHLDQFLAGLIMTVPALLSIIVAPVAGSLADRHGSLRISLIAVGLASAGFLVFFTFNPLTLLIVIIAGLIITRVSTAAFFGPNAKLIMNHCPPGSLGDGSGVMMMVRHVGMVLGVALFQSVFAIRMYMMGVPRDGTPLVPKLTPAMSVLGYQAVYLTSFILCILVILFIRMTKEEPVPEGDEADKS
ncbi:MAG: MFS transporter [Methanoregula sp.]|nr:MFS transporter [Methanoregula sp.]